MPQINILKGPIITEKSLKDASRAIYTFMVEKKATKPEIAKAIASQFKVKVLAVKTLIVKPRPKRAGRKRQISYSQAYKKAYVQIPTDQKIELFEQGKK